MWRNETLMLKKLHFDILCRREAGVGRAVSGSCTWLQEEFRLSHWRIPIHRSTEFRGGILASSWLRFALHVSWQLLKMIVCIWDRRHSYRNLLGTCKLGLHSLQHVGIILTLLPFFFSFFFCDSLHTVNSYSSFFLEVSKRQKFPLWVQISTAKPLRLMKYISAFTWREGGGGGKFREWDGVGKRNEGMTCILFSWQEIFLYEKCSNQS